MTAKEIIARKRDGCELTPAEIAFLIEGACNGTVPPYQISAWLMAVYLKGMTQPETLALTLAMRDSGDVVDLSDLAIPTANGDPSGVPLDKHSTGGVGDKTTLVVVPILVAAGIPILKMSGRGLGFSGGTVDKLESIPGYRSNLTAEEAKKQVRRIGGALIGQSASLAPADKILYALRDVTATVESIPLIASSIMSKKLASGGQRIVLDVKVGRGSFMKTLETARTLAQEMVRIGNGAGVPTVALLTAMEEPLGRMVGNALEVREAVEALLDIDRADPAFRTLCIALAAHGLIAAEKAPDEETATSLVENLLRSGSAANKFAQIIAAQGGPPDCQAILKSLPIAPLRYPVTASYGGSVTALDGEIVGKLAVGMGAGRQEKDDTIDASVGIELLAKTGDWVVEGQSLAILHTAVDASEQLEPWEDTLRSAYRFSHPADRSATNPPTRSPILEIVNSGG